MSDIDLDSRYPRNRNQKRSLISVTLGLIFLSGCASTAPPLDTEKARFDAMTPCEQAVELLSYPDTGYMLKQAVFEKAKNMGCFGSPQPQRLVIR